MWRWWGWLALLAGLVVLAVLLAWADSTILRPVFPQPFEAPRRAGFRPPPTPTLVLPPFGRQQFGGFGRVGGLYTFWWFLSLEAGIILVSLGALLALPTRIRRAAERVRPASLSIMLAAGVAAILLGLAMTVLLRTTFLLLSLVPLLWAAGALGVLFGEAALTLAFGRWLRSRLGPAPTLLVASVALLLVLDIGLVPIAGWLFLLAVAVTSLGLAVLTRMGSPIGWSLEELNW